MFLTFLKVAGFIGGLVIAGISAYSAYKKTTAAKNCGTHTLTNSAQFPYGNYGYGYSAPTSTTTKVYNSNAEAVADSSVESVTETGNVYEDIERLKLMIKIAKLKLQLKLAQIRQQSAAPAPVPTPAPAPVPVPVEPMPQLPMNEVVEPETAKDPQILAWEESQDIALAKINQGINPNTNTTIPVNTNPYNAPMNVPMSDIGRGAMNCSYNFDMFRGFEQFCDTDLYRRLTASRQPQLPVVNYDTGMNPFNGTPNNNPTTIALGTTISTMPTPVIDVPSSQVIPVNEGMPDFSTRKTEHYGHYGDPIPSTRRTYHYGNI